MPITPLEHFTKSSIQKSQGQKFPDSLAVKDLCCHYCGLIPSLETSACCEHGQKQTQKTKKKERIFRLGAVETNLTRNHEVASLILGLTRWVKDPALP